MYRTFFSKKARWRKEKERYKKFALELKTILSSREIEYFQVQLKTNNYLWDIKNIALKNRVFIEKKYNYTREEAKINGVIEKDELGRVLIHRTNRYFTFSKPIYSKNHKTALITYNYYSNFILYVFEKINDTWVFKFVLSENYLI